MKDWFLDKYFQLEDWYYDITKFVSCYDELRSPDLHNGKYLSIGAFCKKRKGHWGRHKTGNGRVTWK